VTKIVNLYGGPSAGKSTMAAQLFGHMKAKRLNVEYVPEFAKTLTWRKSECIDDHEIYTLKDQVDYIITDSPLLLSLHYIDNGLSKFGRAHDVKWSFTSLVKDTYKVYDNYDYYVERGDRAFIQAGRTQNEYESRLIDISVLEILEAHTTYKRISTLDDIIGDLLGPK
jgi:hypothetical protein